MFTTVNVSPSSVPGLYLTLCSLPACLLAACRPATTKRRIVRVTDPCAASGETWCYSLRRCSVALQCVAVTLKASSSSSSSGGSSSSSGSGSSAPNRPLLVVAKDTAPPRISVQGTGSTGLNPQGEALMIDSVLFASDWSDPGATASDANELGVTVDVTDRLQVWCSGVHDARVARAPVDADRMGCVHPVHPALGSLLSWLISCPVLVLPGPSACSPSVAIGPLRCC